MTSELITGAEWLDKLNLDILYHICWFLDVKSIVRLALVSGTVCFPLTIKARPLSLLFTGV